MMPHRILFAITAALLAGRPAVPAPVQPVWPGGVTEVCAGEVRINRVPARYALLEVPAGSPGWIRNLGAQGWHPRAIGPGTLAGPGGGMTIRTFEREGGHLILAVPSSDADWAVTAVFSGVPSWAGEAGDVPGREPLGLPRPGGARRVLHLEGAGFEAACYRSPASPHAVVAEAAARWSASGWTVTPVGPAGLSAVRRGAPPVAVHAEAEGTGSTFLLLAGSLTR